MDRSYWIVSFAAFTAISTIALVVNDDVVEAILLCHLLVGGGEARLDGRFVFRRAVAQAALQFFHGRRREEDEAQMFPPLRLTIDQFANLSRPLHVDIQQHVDAGAES